MRHPRVDLLFEFIETTPQRRWERRCGRQNQAEAGAQDPGVGASAKDNHSEPKGGEAVTVGLGNPFDQSVQAEASQLIGHATLGELVDGLAAQSGQVGAQVAIGESRREQIEK